jgi:hypothetical protein
MEMTILIMASAKIKFSMIGKTLERRAQEPTQREVPAGSLAERVLQAAQQQSADHDTGDDGLDEVGLPERGAEEPAPAPLAAGVVPLPDDDEVADADQRQPGEDVGPPLEDDPVADDRQREPRIEHLPVRGGDQRAQREEAHEHEPMHEADCAPLQHPGVAEGLGQHGPPARARFVGAGGCRPAQPNHAQHASHRADGEHHRHRRDRQGHDDRHDLHGRCSSSLLLVSNLSLAPTLAVAERAISYGDALSLLCY